MTDTMRDCQPRNLFLKIFMYKDLKCIKHASGKLKGQGREERKEGGEKQSLQDRKQGRAKGHVSETSLRKRTS